MNSIYYNKKKMIINQLEKYNMISTFSSVERLDEWIDSLSEIEAQNILDLDINVANIMFDISILFNRDLLSKEDYLKRVEAILSIKNARGREHLFSNMLSKEFLNSPKFYQDIETMKRAKSAQMCLWIIGDPIFINSPFHDEDFEILVTAEDTSGKGCDSLVWDAIAKVAASIDSINSGHHQDDIKTILKYSAPVLQRSSSFPEGSINYLAVNSVSLKDPYHLENMELLAQNNEIGNFLYPIMTNEVAIKRGDYRTIIREMIEHKDNEYYAFLLCIYVLGVEEAKRALNILQLSYLNRIEKNYDLDELLYAVQERLSIIDASGNERYAIEASKEISNPTIKKSFWDFLKRNKRVD